MAWYTGEIYRGVDYNPTWPGWVVGANATQTGDSDFANDAFASLWGAGYQAPPAGDTSAPVNNGSNYRDDLKTIADAGFNLVRLYNWDMARGTTSSSNTGLDHINFLNYAQSLGLKVVVPVGDFFLNDTQFSWNHVTPNASYSFSSASPAIQTDFTQFINSITDPATGKIHSAVHSISVGNEGDIGEGLQGPPITLASDFLARTNWWIVNLHQQINGTSATGPDGNPVVNGSTGTIVPLSATFANADQGTGISSWFKALVSGVQAGQATPNKWIPNGTTTFTAAVTGLATADPNFESYYYNSFNIGQSTTTPPFGNGIKATLALYDSGASPWPGEKFNVPLLLMEVFNPNRSQYPTPADQALAAVNEAKAIEEYLALNNAGTPRSTTNLMGYNYFEFNDEPAANKMVGLYQYTQTSQNAQTGTTSVFYDPFNFPNVTFPVYTLTPTPGPGGQGTLVGAWTGQFPQALQAYNDAYVILEGNSLTTSATTGVTGNDQSTSPPAVALQSGVASGALQLGQDGAVAYTPNPGFNGIETFGYYGYGEYGASDSGQATIHVVPIIVGPTSTTLDLLALTAAEQIGSTYAAFFGRAADEAGFDYWVGELNRMLPTQGPAATLDNIANAFGVSAEATTLYPFLANPVGASDAEIAGFLNSVYNNLFERSSDTAGLAYWTGQIKQMVQAGQFVGSVLVDIMSGAKETAGSQDITTLMSKVAVSLAYVHQQELQGTVWAGASDIAAATALLDSVTADPQSVLVGVRTAAELIANHA